MKSKSTKIKFKKFFDRKGNQTGVLLEVNQFNKAVEELEDLRDIELAIDEMKKVKNVYTLDEIRSEFHTKTK